MGTATKITGESFGYRFATKLKILNGTKFISTPITPVDADLHDISKEGLLVTSLSWRASWVAASNEYFLALFNRTSSVSPVTNALASAYRDSMGQVTSGAAFSLIFPQAERNLSILPGGGVPLIGDFITLSVESAVNVGADVDVVLDLYYKWININSDDYRKILYARSI